MIKLKSISILLFMLTCLASCQKHPVKACFTYTPLNITTNTVVNFDASCTKNPYKYTWHFNDGSRDTSLIGNSNISHQFILPGNYTVSLNISKKDGQIWGKDISVAEQTIIVK
jgi:PKD repeat protein